MRIIYNLITKVVFVGMKIFLRVEIIHPERLEQAKGSIIASNHISNFDPPYIGSVIPAEIYYLAKSELFKFKPIGAFISFLNAISINRGKTDLKAIKKCIKILNNGNSLLMFPQGTRNGTTAKAGIGMMVLLLKKDVVPLCIKDSDHFLDLLLRKKRLKIVIGEKISHDLFLSWKQERENYQKVADYIFDKINELKHEAN